MYFKGVPHGIALHHFHNERHSKRQGSISGQDFEDMLRFVGLKRIIDPAEWLRRLEAGWLNNDDLCLTFDDGLLCQFEIALPVLEKYNLKAFWFIYSSVFESGFGSKLEIYKTFYSTFYKDIDEFYVDFFDRISGSRFAKTAQETINEETVRKFSETYPFYSFNDIKFRFIRDRVLGPREFQLMMDAMIRERGLSLMDLAKNLWMSDKNLVYLNNMGHNLGMHSYSHPTSISDLSPQEQYEEYVMNHNHLRRVCGKPPLAMAHPNGSYNKYILEILKELGIQCGFTNVSPQISRGSLKIKRHEIAREDHSNIMRIKLSSSVS